MRGTEAAVYVDQFIFSCVTSQMELSMTTAEQESTTLCSTGAEFEPILSTAKITQAGWFNGVATGGFEREAYRRLADNGALVTALFCKDTQVDCPAYTIPLSSGIEMAFSVPVAGLITLNGTWGTCSPIRRGMRIFGAAITTTGGKTSYDYRTLVPAPTGYHYEFTSGGAAYMHVTAISGTATNADIDIESSADDNTFASEGTFTFSAVGGYTLPLSGTVNRYLRINATDLGGATSITATVVVSLNLTLTAD